MRAFCIFLIALYQKYISPYKGFRCAYGCYYHTKSCSAIIKHIIATQGLIAGWPLIRQQFVACRLAYEALQQDDNNRNNRRRRPNRQRPCSRRDACECSTDILPEVPCDVPCVFYLPLKSIQKKTLPDNNEKRKLGL